MDNIDKIKALRAEADRLETEQKQFDSNTPEIKLATLLHQKLCHSNHIDYCGWDYESWGNMGYAKESYLAKAKAILSVVSYTHAILVINKL